MDEQDSQLDPFAKSIEEEQAAQKALLSRYEQLQNTLQQRTNLPFDPTLMKISQALLSPTKSGSFGESLGMGVQALVEGSEQEQVRQQNLAKMQAELEEKVLGIKQKGSQLQAIRQLAGYGRAPAGTGAPAGAAAGAPAGAPAGAANAASALESSVEKFGIQITDGDPHYLKSDQQLIQELWTSGVRDLQKIQEEIRRYHKDRLDIKEGSIYNRGTGKISLIPTGKTVDGLTIYNPDGSYMGSFDGVDSGMAARLNSFPPGSQAYNELAAIITGTKRQQPPAPSAPPEGAEPTPSEAAPSAEPPKAAEPATAAGQRTTPTASERAATREALQEEARTTAKGAGELTNKWRSAAEVSGTLMSTGESMVRLINTNPDAFRIMSKPGVGQSVARAISEGLSASVGGGSLSINLPVKKLLEAGLTQKELDTLSLFANQLATMKQANREMSRIPGEGTTSDLETRLANEMISVENASPEAIKMITTATMMRARYADQRFDLLTQLKSRGLTTDQALASQEMKDLKSGYREALTALAQQNANLLKPTKTIRGTIKSPESSESDVPPGYIRDPKTKKIRRKLEGE